ncbi:hypothetical protein RJ640_010152 [Escallonia rubra]|uniref:thymidine kinase n=1 Tax=Escallonia rubra TaxID=112253 RepID=A0AA88QT26_9ASTE|nr:hypothetical protein RJ640_010152 [Escallonia rubra]
MLAISRMKSLISPTFSHFTLTLTKPTSLFLFPQPSTSSFGKVRPSQNGNFIHVQPAMHFPNSSASLNPSGACASPVEGSEGEIHVIVGPMFAGKTTTLLRRIRAESTNGRLRTQKELHRLDETLKGLCFSGRLAEAVGLLCRTGLQVESETYSLLLQDCIFRKEYKKGIRVHWQMTIFGFVPNEYLKTKLLILYAKAGDLETAHVLFEKLLTKSLVSWNAMLAGYVQKGLEDVGLSLYYRMKRCGIIPDQYTFASVFRACATLAILEQGKQAHGILIKSQMCGNVVVNSSLVDMYFKCSCPGDGHLVFVKALDRNVITWTALISGYGLNGSVIEVLKSFNMMISEGLRPNYVTFLAVLCACSHGGLVDEGWKYFNSMVRDYGIQPSGKHYAAMVDLLGRAGRLEEAFEFIRNSPCKEHPAIWGALLGACRIHENMDILTLATKKFFELESENAGKYVVLSNAYATFGSWGNVAEVRRAMKALGVKKEPGYSMIEVQREVNFFFMEHNSQKQADQLYGLIKDLTCILKDAGYSPESVAIIKSNKDTRYGLDSIVTHDGEKLPCWPLADLSSFRQKIGLHAYNKLDVIGIDEAQFFGDLHDFCSKAADRDGKTVIVAGLDGDYLRRSFGSVLDIIPIADSVTKLSARCELCGKRALFTLRKTEETERELIAGADVYMPVCRKHYVSGQVVKEATRTVLETDHVQCASLL